MRAGLLAQKTGPSACKLDRKAIDSGDSSEGGGASNDDGRNQMPPPLRGPIKLVIICP